ncbi:MAG: hypothetical protein J5663_03785 [Bacteroidaceae bacterium]|nr:hypothetical protein [Bacteroidaceae bacterium]
MKKLLLLFALAISNVVNAQIFNVKFGDEYNVANPAVTILIGMPSKETKSTVKIEQVFKNVTVYGSKFKIAEIQYTGTGKDGKLYLDNAFFSNEFYLYSDAVSFIDKISKVLLNKFGEHKIQSVPEGYSFWVNYGKSPSFDGNEPLCSLSMQRIDGVYYVLLNFGPFYMAHWLEQQKNK